MPAYSLRAVLAGALFTALPIGAAAEPRAHNVILFVPDGLRSQMVTAQTAPAMNAIKTSGVFFANSHALFPTFTTANASAMATGHYLGDTGDFSNTIYSGFAVPSAASSVTPFLENDAVLGDVNTHFSGNYLDEETILAAAREAGFSTAAVGKVGPVLIFDSTDRTGQPTIVIDDQTGSPQGIPLDDPLQAAMQAAGMPIIAPARGANGKPGDSTSAGTTVANVEQQKYFADVFANIVLPQFKARDKPFVAVFWSRDPDGTQHNQGDSLGKLVPGINGPTSLASIRNADDNLEEIRAALARTGLSPTTDIIVTADHGFSTIAKTSMTSPSTQKLSFTGVPSGWLPPGFVAIDIAQALGLPLADPDKDNAVVDATQKQFPSKGNGVIGIDHTHPDVVVAANGGSDLVYLPQPDAKATAAKVIASLLAQDYVSGLFVDDRLGSFPGTLPLSAINFMGSARTPEPAIVVNFRSFSTGCSTPTTCTVEIADTALQQGQGMHGSFSRADTYNFEAAFGPDFKHGFVDRAPSSNADIGLTIARIMHMHIAPIGHLAGRVLSEALPTGTMPLFTRTSMRSTPAGGLATVMQMQSVGATRYFDAAGFPGRTIGLGTAP